MGELKVKDKEVVVPGEIVASGMDFLPASGMSRNDKDIVATRVGLVSVEGRAIKLIPLSGKYSPKRGDTIIAKITDVLMSGWRADINCAYSSMLGLKDATSEFITKGADLTKYYNFGDHIVCKITQVTSQKLIDLSMKGPGLRKLGPGRIVHVDPNKVPRVIGKRGSMISMIKNATGCQVIVGQNGLIWLSGQEPKLEHLAVRTIKMIESQSHISGLTDKIKGYLEKETGKKLQGDVQ